MQVDSDDEFMIFKTNLQIKESLMHGMNCSAHVLVLAAFS